MKEDKEINKSYCRDGIPCSLTSSSDDNGSTVRASDTQENASKTNIL